MKGNHINHDLLVANLKPGQYDSRGNPLKDRTGWHHAFYVDQRGRTRNVWFEGTLSGATAEVTVANNDFTAAAILTVGEYILTSGVNWTPGGTTTDSATALAAAIDRIPRYSASSVGAIVTITGPNGPAGIGLTFTARYEGAIVNFTLAPTTGEMTPGGPTIGGTSSIP